MLRLLLRLRARPAPWHVDPNVSPMPFSVPGGGAGGGQGGREGAWAGDRCNEQSAGVANRPRGHQGAPRPPHAQSNRTRLQRPMPAALPRPALPRPAAPRTREHVAAGAHGAADEHGLPRELVVDWDEGVVGREGARGALAVHQQRLELAIHQVLLHLGVRWGWGGGKERSRG